MNKTPKKENKNESERRLMLKRPFQHQQLLTDRVKN